MLHKVVKIFLDDSKDIVNVAAKIMDNTHGKGLIGGMRISGERKATFDSPIQAGYTVLFTGDEHRGFIAKCDDPDVEVTASTEDKAMELIIAEIEKVLKTNTSITRVEE